MTSMMIPSREALKAHAKRLRAALRDHGTPISHSAALETTAQQWGYRDWNTASAAAGNAPAWQVGQSVTGRYLGHAFRATLRAVRAGAGGHWHLTLVFDEPIDVVSSDRFSSLRRQVSATVTEQGITHEKTSDGQPHLVLDPAL